MPTTRRQRARRGGRSPRPSHRLRGRRRRVRAVRPAGRPLVDLGPRCRTPGCTPRAARAGQLARLAHRDEPAAQVVGGRAEDEPARLDPDDDVGNAPAYRRPMSSTHRAERLPVGEQRGEVLEEDAGLGEVRDVADPAEDQLPDRPVRHAQRFDLGVRRGWCARPLLAHLCTSARRRGQLRLPRGRCRRRPAAMFMQGRVGESVPGLGVLGLVDEDCRRRPDRSPRCGPPRGPGSPERRLVELLDRRLAAAGPRAVASR